MEYIGKFTLGLISIVLGVLLGGLIVMNFWTWFIVPVFNLKVLTFGNAIGISTFLTLFKTANIGQKTDVSSSTILLTSLVYQLLIFGSGWIVSLFI